MVTTDTIIYNSQMNSGHRSSCCPRCATLPIAAKILLRLHLTLA